MHNDLRRVQEQEAFVQKAEASKKLVEKLGKEKMERMQRALEREEK